MGSSGPPGLPSSAVMPVSSLTYCSWMPLRHAAVVRVALGPAAGDDVLGDLGGELVRGLLVEVHDGRDVPRDVGERRGRESAWCPSWIDPWPVVVVRVEDAHEREPRRAAPLTRVEQDDRDVARPAVEVAEQG